MKKDSIYRLKNNEKMPWRPLLFGVAKQFQKHVNPEKEIANNSAFILDDTTEAKTGRRIEQISYIHDHVAGRKGNKLSFKNLTLGFFDGKSFTPLDFSLHSEKQLKKPVIAKNSLKSNAILKLGGQTAFVNANAIKSRMACLCSNVLYAAASAIPVTLR